MRPKDCSLCAKINKKTALCGFFVVYSVENFELKALIIFYSGPTEPHAE